MQRVVSLAKIVFEYTHLHCWNSCKWKITRYKIQNWYRYLNMNREWTDMNSNTIFYCALCHQADDPFFDVSACANSMCQWEFVVVENYRCRTYTWNMFAFVVHCILYIITALCTLCGMSMFFFCCFIYSRFHSKFSMEMTVLCVYGCECKIVYEHGILHALVFVQYQFHLTSVIALEIVVIIIYDVVFLLLLLPFVVGFNWHQHPGITIIHIRMHLFYQNRSEKTSSKG